MLETCVVGVICSVSLLIVYLFYQGFKAATNNFKDFEFEWNTNYRPSTIGYEPAVGYDTVAGKFGPGFKDTNTGAFIGNN